MAKALEKVRSINEAIQSYFELNPSIAIIPAKDMMLWFIQKGIFEKDHRKGFPIRKVLNDLDEAGLLHLIPFTKPERKLTNINWFFIRSINLNPNEASTLIQFASVSSSIPKKKSDRDEYYVIDLCDKVLDLKAIRQHTFDFLKGDANKKGEKDDLPVDAFYREKNLVIEYCEIQHSEPVKLFDKRQTISGITRGEQRKLYDQRRKDTLPKHGIILAEIPYSAFRHTAAKKIIRNESTDLLIVQQILKDFL